jgi:hypothetical protein
MEPGSAFVSPSPASRWVVGEFFELIVGADGVKSHKNKRMLLRTLHMAQRAHLLSRWPVFEGVVSL